MVSFARGKQFLKTRQSLVAKTITQIYRHAWQSHAHLRGWKNEHGDYSIILKWRGRTRPNVLRINRNEARKDTKSSGRSLYDTHEHRSWYAVLRTTTAAPKSQQNSPTGHIRGMREEKTYVTESPDLYYNIEHMAPHFAPEVEAAITQQRNRTTQHVISLSLGARPSNYSQHRRKTTSRSSTRSPEYKQHPPIIHPILV